MHDKRSKFLYFLWNEYYDYETNEYKKRSESIETAKSIQCGCIGGCHFYGIARADFLETIQPLSKYEGFGKSLFKPDTFILYSQAIMLNKYEIELYEFQLDDLKFNSTAKSIVKRAPSTKSLKHVERRAKILKKMSSKSVSNLMDRDDYYTASESEDANTTDFKYRVSTLKHNDRSSLKMHSISSLNSVANSTLRFDANQSAIANDRWSNGCIERPSKLDLNLANHNQRSDSNISESGSVIINICE
jgi:hypothetical protein